MAESTKRDQSFSSKCARQWLLAQTMGKRDAVALKAILMRADFDPDEVYCKDRETCSPIFMTLANGWVLGLHLLVQAGANINQQLEIVECRHTKTRHQMTPLMVAIDNHHYDLVRTVVDLGGDILICDPNTNVSPLYIAAYSNQPCVLAFLLSSIERKHKTSSSFEKILNLATTQCHATPLAAALGNMGFRYDTIYPSSPFTLVKCDELRQEKALTVIEILLRAGTDMNVRDIFSLPLPFLCATCDDIRVLSMFISHGLDVNLKAMLDLSSRGRHNQIALPLPPNFSLVTFYIHARSFMAVRLLLNAGCELSIEDRKTLLVLAREVDLSGENTNDEKVKCLLEVLNHITSVPSMMWLCKKAVRSHLQPCRNQLIKKLPLPRLLIKYLADVHEEIR